MSHQIPYSPEERINAARGYKAALHNEHVSPEAKEHAREMLLKLDEQQAHQELMEESMHVPYHHHRRERSCGDDRQRSPQERINAARGYKAAMHNPLVSEEGKAHAREMLQLMNDEEARQELYSQDERPKDPTRVAAGLKAAQKNPLVSEEGRRRAAKHLHEIEMSGPEE
ncbi:uncharacterized protein N7496_005700 [Penicillium cataractarum]|uniref:Conidiation protein Con-6 n=1 Tax=Penicillium cataractarum TaxID=2100454 RepID=A0A9W9SGQ5_9EURO|nr:uncharacterized protein N7496_005700 [Penicillium cataractarum]KAJ5378291.1 hypothetical protein N7496_005700 [Penicillium cataractarum]